MRLATSALVIGIALCAGTVDARDVTEKNTIRQTLRFSGDGAQTLEVRGINGSITVEAHDGPDVEMLIEKSVTAESQAGLHAAEEVELDFEDNAATVGAIVRQPDIGVCGLQDTWSRTRGRPRYFVQFDFTIRVPRNTRLELCTVNKGDITVKGTHADFTVRNINGRITMTDVAGSGDATTINGRVTASFVSPPRTDSHFKTINGDVVLSMPDTFSADLHMKSFNGGLFTDFVTQPLAHQLVAEEHSGGATMFRSNSFTRVRVGTGGPVLTLDTLNGDVRVLRRAP